MKPLRLLAVLFAFLLALLAPAGAQEPVTTGVVQEVNPQNGMLVVRSDQLNRPVVFYGMNSTNIFAVEGHPAQLSDLSPGTKVTVQYAVRENLWYISKLMFSSRESGSSVVAPVSVQPPVNVNPSVSGGRPDPADPVRPVQTVNGTSPGGN